jgi:YegS/Rv2252/BmrU family lipid kinase
MKALIIINPSSGKEKAKDYEEKLVEVLKSRYDEINIKYTKKKNDAKNFAYEAANEDYDLVISLGGDGTVNETVNGIAPNKKRPALGIIPMGTVNDLARALDIPLDPDEAIDMLKDSKEKEIDIGMVNERYFTNVVSVGNIAKAVHEVESEEKSKLGPLAYFIAGTKEVINSEDFLVKLKYENKLSELKISLLAIGLSGALAGFGDFLKEAKPDDGKLHVLAIKSLDIGKALKILPSAVTGKITESENVIYFTTDNINVRLVEHEEKESDIDGEKGPILPLDIKVLPKHLKVMIKNS